jgi:hypothetical protein
LESDSPASVRTQLALCASQRHLTVRPRSIPRQPRTECRCMPWNVREASKLVMRGPSVRLSVCPRSVTKTPQLVGRNATLRSTPPPAHRTRCCCCCRIRSSFVWRQRSGHLATRCCVGQSTAVMVYTCKRACVPGAYLDCACVLDTDE